MDKRQRLMFLTAELKISLQDCRAVKRGGVVSHGLARAAEGPPLSLTLQLPWHFLGLFPPSLCSVWFLLPLAASFPPSLALISRQCTFGMAGGFTTAAGTPCSLELGWRTQML